MCAAIAPASRELNSTLSVERPPLPQAAKKKAHVTTPPMAAPIAPALATAEVSAWLKRRVAVWTLFGKVVDHGQRLEDSWNRSSLETASDSARRRQPTA